MEEAGGACPPPPSTPHPENLVQYNLRNKVCAYCRTPGARLKCKGCRQRSYCDRGCQKKDWKQEHRRQCVKLQQVFTPSACGRKDSAAETSDDGGGGGGVGGDGGGGGAAAASDGGGAGSTGVGKGCDHLKDTIPMEERSIITLLESAHGFLADRQLGLGSYNEAKGKFALILLRSVLERVLTLDQTVSESQSVKGWHAQACTDQLHKLREIASATGSRWHGCEACLELVQGLLYIQHHPEDVPEMARVNEQWKAQEAKDDAVKEKSRQQKLNGGDECLICLELLRVGENIEQVKPLGCRVATPRVHASICTLPCSHRFHAECMVKLRESCEAKVCPACRAELPPPANAMFVEACLLHVGIENRVAMRADGSWCLASQSDKDGTAKVQMDAFLVFFLLLFFLLTSKYLEGHWWAVPAVRTCRLSGLHSNWTLTY